jgi:alpha-beta hydrolase superfamily lysophospholipase
MAAFWPRKLSHLPAATDRLFEVEPGTRLLAKCHWQRDPQRHPTLVLIHGLEGSSESRYILGIAEKGFVSGFNILRMNQRSCGGTEHLTPTLYNAGLTGDYRAVLQELIERDALPDFLCRVLDGRQPGAENGWRAWPVCPTRTSRCLCSMSRPGSGRVVGRDCPAT